MGLRERLFAGKPGVTAPAKPEEGALAIPAEELSRRLAGISGRGIETAARENRVAIAWAAEVVSATLAASGREHLTRAIVIDLDEGATSATGTCLKHSAAPGRALASAPEALDAPADWERGQFLGTETVRARILAGEGALSREETITFGWDPLREAIVEAVTKAGWTYVPAKP